MNDTDPEIAELVRTRLLERTGAERVRMGVRCLTSPKQWLLASFPPGLSDTELKIRLCTRLYGDEVDRAGFRAHLESLQSDNLSD